MAERVAVDLHVHTALSPCGGEEMTPPAVLLTAERRGVGVIGIVDHSSAGNARAFLEAAEAFDARVFVGLEVESAEGVHVLALFGDAEAATDMSTAVRDHLPDLVNRPDVLGEQLLVDAWGDVIGTERRLLLAGTDLSIEAIAQMTADRDGMSIPAHVDRAVGGLLPILGFVPPSLQVTAYEVSRRLTIGNARREWPDLAGRPLTKASDAHFLEDIGGSVTWVCPRLAAADVSAKEWGRMLSDGLLAPGA